MSASLLGRLPTLFFSGVMAALFWVTLPTSSALAQTNVPSQNGLVFERILHRLFLEGIPIGKAIREIRDAREYDRWTNSAASPLERLKAGSELLDGRVESQLAFANYEEEFEDITRMTIGYCWGHATVTRKFAHFARFGGTGGAALLQSEPGRARIQSWIDSVMANQRTTIEGFANLQEFSSNPVVEDMLKRAVVKNWADLAVSYRAIRAYATNLKAMKAMDFEIIWAKIAASLARNQKPKLYLVRKASPLGGHILLANRIETGPHGQRVLCLIDNVVDAVQNGRCEARFEFGADGKLVYIKPGKTAETLRTVSFVPEEKTEIVGIARGLGQN